MERGDERVCLDNLRNGEVLERFRREFDRVIENIADPETTLGKRAIVVKLEIKPNKSRTQNETSVSFTTKLAPGEPIETTVFISHTRAGLIASEYNPKEPYLPADSTNPDGANVTQLQTINGGRN